MSGEIPEDQMETAHCSSWLPTHIQSGSYSGFQLLYTVRLTSHSPQRKHKALGSNPSKASPSLHVTLLPTEWMPSTKLLEKEGARN